MFLSHQSPQHISKWRVSLLCGACVWTQTQVRGSKTAKEEKHLFLAHKKHLVSILVLLCRPENEPTPVLRCSCLIYTADCNEPQVPCHRRWLVTDCHTHSLVDQNTKQPQNKQEPNTAIRKLLNCLELVPKPHLTRLRNDAIKHLL